MNHRDDPSHDSGQARADHEQSDQAREWRLQERALHDERAGAATGDDPLLAQYRSVARALRQAQPAVPEDFAAVVASAARARVAATASSSTFERGLLRGLFAILVLSGLVATVLYGGQWMQGFALLWSRAPIAASNWMLLLAACIAMSWSLRFVHLPRTKSGAR